MCKLCFFLKSANRNEIAASYCIALGIKPPRLNYISTGDNLIRLGFQLS